MLPRDPIQLAGIALAALLVAAWLYTLPSDTPPPRAEAPAPTMEAEAAPALRDDPMTLGGGGDPARALDAPRDTARQEAPGAATSAGETMAPAADAHVVTLENAKLRVRVSNQAGRVESVELLEFKDRVSDDARPVQLVTAPQRGLFRISLGEGVLEPFTTAAYTVVSSDKHSFALRLEQDDLRVDRVFSIDSDGYGASLRVRLENRSTATVRPEYRMLLYGIDRPSGAPDRFQRYALSGMSDSDVERTLLGGIDSPGFLRGLTGQGPWRGDSLEAPVGWMGLGSQYFLAAALPENPTESRGFVGPIGRDAGVAVLAYPPVDVPGGTGIERSYRLFLGPKVPRILAAVDVELDSSIEAGWRIFRPLVDLFAELLVWTHDNVVANYGVAIILVTIMIRLLTYPLTQKSMKSMKRLQIIAPEMKAVQEKFKDDRDRMQQEVMALYKRTGINPMTALGGGCVPMLLQFPFLIALYFALQASIELRHAGFMFWINDLSAPENLFSVAGVPIRPLPLMMGATMVLQQRLTPAAGADPQQKQMMTMMSVAFIFLFYQFPSGLVLYWFVSNLLGIAQQLLVNRAPRGAAAK